MNRTYKVIDEGTLEIKTPGTVMPVMPFPIFKDLSRLGGSSDSALVKDGAEVIVWRFGSEKNRQRAEEILKGGMYQQVNSEYSLIEEWKDHLVNIVGTTASPASALLGFLLGKGLSWEDAVAFVKKNHRE